MIECEICKYYDRGMCLFSIWGSGYVDDMPCRQYDDMDEDETEWLPCSEIFPATDDKVLICTKDGNITVGWRWNEKNGGWFICDGYYAASDGDIAAWMPLPEPYNPIEGAMNPPEEEGDQKK